MAWPWPPSCSGFLFGIHVRSSGVTNRAHLLWVLANVASGIALQFVGEARTGVSTLSIALVLSFVFSSAAERESPHPDEQDQVHNVE